MDTSGGEVNPYEAPHSSDSFSVDDLTEPAYADGVDLVFRSDFVSPRVCLITGKKVAKHVEPMKFPVFNFYMKNYPYVKVLYIALLAWIVLGRFFAFGSDFPSNVPLYLLFTVHLFPLFLKNRSHIDFYYVEYLRVKETKKSWKMMLILLPAIAIFIYGASTQSYMLTVISLLIVINFIIIVKSGRVVKPKQGDKHYYRLGEVHPDYLALLPRLPN